MAPRKYKCKNCPLNHGRTHDVLAVQRLQHQAAIAAVQETRPAQSPQEDSSSASDTDALANVFTGLVVSDDGPDVRGQQHSRLFSSRAAFQASLPAIALQLQPPTHQEAIASFEAVAKAAPRIAPPTRKALRETSLNEMLKRIRTAHETLDLVYAMSNESQDASPTRMALDAAAEIVVEAGNLLRSVQAVKHDQKLRKLWDDVHAEAEMLDKLVDCVGAIVPTVEDEEPDMPVEYNTDHHYENPIEDHNSVAQLVILLIVIANVIIGVGTDPCNFLLDSVQFIIRTTIALLSPPDTGSNVTEQIILSELPTTLENALKTFKVEPKTKIFATCTDCHHTHEPQENRLTGEPTYPTHCQNLVFRDKHGPARLCGAPLLEDRQGKLRPIKPFVFPDFTDHLASVLSDPEIVALCNSACDKAWEAMQSKMNADPPGRASADEVNSVFEAEFLRNFEGPVPDQLFINRGGRMRLAFEILIDFFNPHGLRKRGNHDSVGIMAVANLNLPEDMRYKPEFMWLSILLGPQEPNHDQIGSYLRPLIDKFVEGWKHGIRLSRTGLGKDGCVVDIAIAITVNDLPAARKILGLAGVNSHHICSICKCEGVQDMYRTDFDDPAWANRDVAELRRWAYEWKNAESQAKRDEIFEKYGVRWSELWCLPYWDPTRMGVIDSMHCILEGLVHYHCRKVLRIDAEVAKKKEIAGIAFEQDWMEYDATDCPTAFLLKKPEKEIKQIRAIQNKLVQSLCDEDEEDDTNASEDESMPDAPQGNEVAATTEAAMSNALHNNNLPSLRFVAYSLGLDVTATRTKADLCKILMSWRRTKPRKGSDDSVPKAINLSQIKFIQRVIAQTATPSWIHSVPHDYGENKAGTIKADEWRILATLYLPIALVLLWADRPPDQHSTRLLGLLDHSMALFQAVTLVCRYTMTLERATKYRELIKTWVDGLYTHHPHTENHAMRPNVHAAFHIFDFLLLFGPVISWWSFPFERMIGYLQQINTASHIGGQLEGTLTRSFFRAAALRRWLRRSDCPEIIKQFKAIFDRTFAPRSNASTSPPLVNGSERAHYMFNGFNFSRASTHLGNSLVLYYPGDSASSPIAGSIEKIILRGETTFFVIRRQAPLPPGKADPFARFWPYFPAVTYSSKMQTIVDTVLPSHVLSHCARFEFSDDRAVILNLSRS